MKKILCLVLVGFMLLTGCQSDKNTSDKITISETTNQTEEEQLQAMATTTTSQTTTSQTTTQATTAVTIETTGSNETATRELIEEKEAEEMNEIIPDVIFFGAYYYPDTNTIFRFIDSEGSIMEYISNEVHSPYYDSPTIGLSYYDAMYPYITSDYIEETYNNLLYQKENSISYKNINEEEKSQYYKDLLKVDINSEIIETPSPAVCVDYAILIYAVRFNFENEMEFIFLGSNYYGSYFINSDKNAGALYDITRWLLQKQSDMS